MARILDIVAFAFGTVLMYGLALNANPAIHPVWFVDLVILVGTLSGFAGVCRWADK